MALISPGVQVTVIDESQYTPTAAGTVAYVLLATAQDKETPGGDLATYTTLATAGQLQRITSQRDLVLKYGVPTFQVDANDNPIHGDERNEYGLQAAYSALGVSNSLYIQRANVDLDQLQGTSIRPTGTPTDGTYWLDISTSGTNWGIYEFNTARTGFTLQTPRVITSAGDVNGTTPKTSIGAIGEYAVVPRNTSNPIYQKGYLNVWNLVGSQDWESNVVTVTGSVANPALTAGHKFVINGQEIVVGTTVANVAATITARGIDGVKATVNSVGQLEIRIDRRSESNGSVADGKVTIAKGTTIGGIDAAEALGLITANSETFFGPTIQHSDFRNVPTWRAADATPRPAGSVWFKTSATGNGANFGTKQYSAALATWQSIESLVFADDNTAIFNLDAQGGGAGIEAGALYVQYDVDANDTATYKIRRKNSSGVFKITGQNTTPSFTATETFTMEVSVPGTLTTQTATITMSGSTASSFVADVLAANLPNIIAAVESSGAVSITHLAGGTIKFNEGTGSPVQDAGLDTAPGVTEVVNNDVFFASPFRDLTYTYSATAPYSDPADGTLWYYNNPLDVDIMINDGSGWKGYRTVSSDARGYDLRLTDPEGPILSTTQPTTQADGTSPVVEGDLWIDTGDLANYPVIRRYNGTTWDLIDNTDQVSIDGILFADARWDTNGTVDPIVDDLVPISALNLNSTVDADCPSYQLYARGTLLFNTRRSGYNVKRFESTYHADATNPPAVLSAWVSHSGVDSDGVPYFGSKAQRNTVVEALKSAIESSTELREEQVEFNLICCPGYPELIQNMITLNNDRKQTAFIIGDSPLDLNSSNVERWIKNTALAVDNGPDGLVSRSEYLGVYYPAGFSTDLGGESIVVPPSHMMLRTYIRSDNVSYPWFAPAGVRRGVIDNASAIGYIDTTEDIFRSIGVTVGLRDVLYADNVNPLTVLPGVGLVAYGQKTRATQTSAMDRVNVARLVCYLRLVLDKVARPFIFEPNDTITRNQVKAAFEAVLNDIVAKRGLYDYLVVCDETNNTPDRIDRNELYVDIAIKPVKAIEFIYVPVRIRNTGAQL